MGKRNKVILVIIAVLILALTCIVAFINISTQHFSRWSWDNLFWARGAMLEDLEKKFDFTGMNIDEVKEILGEKALIENYPVHLYYQLDLERTRYYSISFYANGIFERTDVFPDTSRMLDMFVKKGKLKRYD